MSVGEAVETEPRRRPGRAIRFALILTAVLLLLFGVPWWTLVASGNDWPTGVLVAGTVIFAAALVVFPLAMFSGHGRHHRDGPAVLGDTMLGVVWQLFVWSVFGQLLSSDSFTDPGRLDAALRAVTSAVAVDEQLGDAEMLSLGYSLHGLTPEHVDSFTAPVLGTGTEGAASVVYLDDVAGERMWGYLRTDSLSQNAEEFSTQALPDVPR